MNSLEELNGYGNDLNLPFTDNRIPNVIFDRTTPVNQSQTGDEGFVLPSSVGIEIVEVANAAISIPSYTINVFNLPGTTVSWTTLPDGVTLTNPSTGVYTLTGISNKTVWDAVKIANINLPTNYNGVWTYTSSISFYSQTNGTVTKSWTTAATINDVVFLTTPLEYRYTSNTTSTIVNTPQIINLDTSYPGVTWTVTGTPNTVLAISDFITTGTGGTFSVNATTKVFTIVGTRTQVNSRLAGLQLVANENTIDFIISYSVSNSLNGTTDNAVQSINSYGLLFLSNTDPFYFIEDAVSTTITGATTITEPDYDGSGTYTFTVTPTNTSAIVTLGAGGTGGTVSFNNSTKVLTISGTRSQVNGRIANLNMTTPVDWANDFAFSYHLNTPRDQTAVKVQEILCGSNDTEITNMNITRAYTANRSNQIFAANTPYISDFDVHEGISYTIGFTSSLGQFAFGTVDVPTNSLTFTGTKSQCNAKFNSIRFYPTSGVFSNGTFTYTQIKNGVTQVNQSVSLTGTYAPYNNTRNFILTSSQTYTPSPDDVKYGNWELVLVGGGGRGGTSSDSQASLHYNVGGGGGGEVLQISNASITNQTYSLTIGGGGSSAPVFLFGSAVPVNGQDTVAFGYTARGGKGGIDAGFSPTSIISGGNAGNGNVGSHGIFNANTSSPGDETGMGGGGAGQGENFSATQVSSFKIFGTKGTQVVNGIYTTTPTTDTGIGSGAILRIEVYSSGTSAWSSNATITILNSGTNYAVGDDLIVSGSVFGAGIESNMVLRVTTVNNSNNTGNVRYGSKGVYISWGASASTIHGWYGGGGSGYAKYDTLTASIEKSGAIGNLISFAASGKTQNNGYTYNAGTGGYSWTNNPSVAPTDAPSGSGGGGGAGGRNSAFGAGGSGVIGVKITSKG